MRLSVMPTVNSSLKIPGYEEAFGSFVLTAQSPSIITVGFKKSIAQCKL